MSHYEMSAFLYGCVTGLMAGVVFGWSVGRVRGYVLAIRDMTAPTRKLQ